jgi:hypothetical protein
MGTPPETGRRGGGPPAGGSSNRAAPTCTGSGTAAGPRRREAPSPAQKEAADPARDPPPRGGNRATRIHAKVRYRCSLPGLAGFTSPRYPDPVTATAKQLAERQGFEPWVPLRIHTRSRRAPSTARSPLRTADTARTFRSDRPGPRHGPGKHGGERGIRTPGTVTGTPDFESGAFDQLGQLSTKPIQFCRSSACDGRTFGGGRRILPRGRPPPLPAGGSTAGRCRARTGSGPRPPWDRAPRTPGDRSGR